ncbi:hypothetical protein [Nonomuraea gerenzanensis]|uniref:Chromosome partition protein smc n=1 Tax=Nonomuraea gerenzanensis TaxID=93944 RepID=A0A1M4DVH6_9ACTN|nr:hypothetical protein [Nonomuraea gerenzanensis]UBU12917.1 hypothetical protein LCN96_53200 [Nonomuraea gerenzanensis]SBO90567.1 Chromosome partition protein smc [Nonomuraea gerenzanensis]
MADPNVKVGAGYIEISPKLSGFNKTLTAKIKDELREIGALEAVIQPTLDENFATKLKTLVEREIKKLGPFKVDVEARLRNTASFQDANEQLRDTVRDTADETSRSTKRIETDFDRSLAGARESISKLDIALRTGLRAFNDPETARGIETLRSRLRDLSTEVDTLSARQSSSIRAGLREIESMASRVERAVKSPMQELERETTKLFRESDKAVKDAQRSMDQYSRAVSAATKIVASAEKEVDRGFKRMGQVVADGLKSATSAVAKSGKDLGERFAGTFESVVFGMIARGGLIGAALAVLGAPLLAGLSNLVAGFTALASSAAYAAGSLLAIPAVLAVIAQGAGVLTAAFWGVGDALDALSKADDQSAANAEAAAQAREAAAERVRSAQERLADAQRSAMERVEQAQARLVDVQEQSARQIESAQDRLADVQARLAEAAEAAASRVVDAQDRIADAQARLVQVQEQGAQRIADAQRRLADVQASSTLRIVNAEQQLQDSHRRTADALADLNQAREEARERLEDLALAEASAALDEEAAQLAVERASQRLTEINLDPKASDLDRREAELAYRQSLQRLDEIRERNEDLRREVEQANKEGIEGSQRVTDAKERLKDAQDAEIEAEKELARVRQEAADEVLRSEQDLAQSRRDAAREYEEAQTGLARAERDLTEARLDGARQVESAQKAIADAERDLARARQDGTRDIAEAEAAIAQARVDGARQIERAESDVSSALRAQADALATTSTQARNAEIALSKLSPAGREFVLFLNNELIPRVLASQQSIQGAFLPPIQEALTNSTPLLQVLQSGLTETGSILGGLIGGFIEFTNTPFFTGRVESILATNNDLFRDMDGVVEDLASGLLILVDSADPFLRWIVDVVKEFANWFAETMKQKEASGELNEFWADVQRTLDLLLQIVVNLGGGFANIFLTGKEDGDDLLTTIRDLSKDFKDWTSSTEGKNQLKEWFENGKKAVNEVILLVRDVSKEFFELGRDTDLSGLIKDIREDFIPAVSTLAKTLSGEEGGGLGFVLGLINAALDLINVNIGAVRLAFGLLTFDSETVSGALETILGSAEHLARTVAQLFGFDLPLSAEDGKKAINQMATDIGKWWGDIGTDIGDWFDDLGTDISDFFSGANETSSSETKIMAQSVGGNFDEMDKAIKEKLEPLKTWIPEKWDEITTSVSTTVTGWKNDLSRWFTGIRDDVDKKWTELTGGIAKGAENAWLGIVRWWNDLPTWAQNKFQEIRSRIDEKISRFFEIGENIVEGFKTGVRNKWDEFVQLISGGIDNIVKWVEERLGINSPSKVFSGIGSSIGEGLIVGIEAQQNSVRNAVSSLATTVTDTWGNPQLGVGIKAGAIPIQSSPTVNTAALTNRQTAGGELDQPVSRVYQVTLNAAPTVPTEQQLVSTLSYVDALYS